MKTIIASINFLIFSFGFTQVQPLEDHTWKLDKIVTADSTLVVPNEITFNGIFQNPNFYSFGNCVFVDGNLSYDNNNQSYTVNFSSIPFQVCPDEQELMDIEEFFQNEFFFDVFMVSWHEPFTYAFSTTTNKIYLDITNNEGSVATFYDNFLNQDNFLKQNLFLYPNPVKDRLFIESPNMALEKVNIYDLSGKMVFEQNDISNDNLDVSHLQSGVYILKIETSVGVVQRKLVKK